MKNDFTVSILMPDTEVLDSFLGGEPMQELKKNFTVRKNTLGRAYTEEELRIEAHNSDVLISGWGIASLGNGICSNSRVKLIAHTGGSVGDLVDDTVYSSNIKVISGNELFAESVAEGTLAYIMSALRRIPDEVNSLKEGGWGVHGLRNKGIIGKTIGIIGYGMISRHLVRMLAPFRTNILIYSSHPIPTAFLEEKNARQASLNEIFLSSDIVSLHSSLNAKTIGMIGKEHFDLLKNGSVFVNTARGAIIREEELIDALRENRFFAVLDVFAKEPLQADSPLRSMDNVYLLPHKAGPTYDFRKNIGAAIVEDIIAFSEGRSLRYEISSDYASRMTRHSMAHK